METATTANAAFDPRQTTSHQGSHAPTVGRDVHARLSGARPNQDADLPPFWGEDGFTFDDLVDLLNPLHHIPLVGSLYRSLSGDQIAAGPRIMGGALFAGGPVGAAVAAAGNTVNASIAHETGNDIGGHVLSWLGIGESDNPATPTPPPAGDPVEVAELTELPWQNLNSVTNPAPGAAAQTPPSVTAAQSAETIAQPAGSTPPQLPETASTMAATDQTNLSDHQWAMLVASLEPQEVARGETRPAGPQNRRATASGYRRGHVASLGQIRGPDPCARFRRSGGIIDWIIRCR